MSAEPTALTESTAGAESSQAVSNESLSADAFLSLGCMEGILDPVVAPVLPERTAQPAVYGGGFTDAAADSLASMEGVLVPIVERAAAADLADRERARLRPGIAMAGSVAVAAYLLHYLPIAPFTVSAGAGSVRHPISAAIIAILTGLLLRNTLALPDSIKAGCKKVVKKTIPFAIVCMGAGLNLQHLAGIGFGAIAVTVLCIAFAVCTTYYIGRLFGLGRKTALLLGAGTGICGNSAIIAVAPLIDAEDDDVVLSVGTVNLFGIAAMLVWPVIGTWLALSDTEFGVWSGTSIHAVPQVVAAGFAFSPEAGAIATLVKLVRVTFLAPIVFVMALLYAKHHAAPTNGAKGALAVHYARLVPWFVWGFVVLAALNTLGFIPTLSFNMVDALSGGQPTTVSLSNAMTTVGKLLLTLAMAAIGLEVNIRQLASVGGKAIAAGLVSTAALGAASLLLISLLL